MVPPKISSSLRSETLCVSPYGEGYEMTRRGSSRPVTSASMLNSAPGHPADFAAQPHGVTSAENVYRRNAKAFQAFSGKRPSVGPICPLHYKPT